MTRSISLETKQRPAQKTLEKLPAANAVALTTPAPVKPSTTFETGSSSNGNALAGELVRSELPPQQELFGASVWPRSLAEIPDLDARYATPQSRAKTVAILGSSSSKTAIEPFVELATLLARDVVGRGGNVVTGAGNAGVMGAAFNAARDAAKKSGAGENLTLIKTPMWGDEDLAGGRAIGQAPSEEARVDKFIQVAATVVAFPGGAGTLLELNKLLFTLAYPAKEQPLPEKIVLVGSSTYWAGFKTQLDTLVTTGLLKAEVLERFRFPEGASELLGAVQ